MVATNLVVNVANAVGDSPMDDEMLFHASLGGPGIIVVAETETRVIEKSSSELRLSYYCENSMLQK